VSAVVGELRRAPAATHDHLTRYDAVMRRLSDQYAAILPRAVRNLLDRGELEFILGDRQASFRRALQTVRGVRR
jgi:hypothetical protein